MRERLIAHLKALGGHEVEPNHWQVGDKTVLFSSEPDIEVRQGDRLIGAVEIKGGIDKAGVLERLGAAVKSLERVKDRDPAAVTILILTEASLSSQARKDLQLQRQSVNRWYTLEQLLQDEGLWRAFLDQLRLLTP